MLNCREVSRVVASDEVADADGLWRFGIRLHLFLCRRCGRYAVQLRVIGSTARDMWRSQTMEPAELERLEQAILHRILGSQPRDH